MNELHLSAHSLDKAACPFRYYLYRVLEKVPEGVAPGLVQGIAGHAAVAAWRRGLDLAAQDKAVDDAFAQAPPIPAEDYRTPQYLKEILVQFRAEHAPEHWVWEEVEQPFEVPLGVVQTHRLGEVKVILTGRRDAVGYDPDSGHRYVIDNKFVSRDDGADYVAAKNSRALKGYVLSYRVQTGKPVHAAVLQRVVIRGPTKAKPLNFTLPPDPPIQFPDAVLEEWQRNTLKIAAAIAERDPEKPEEWPMEESVCRHTFGCCDYLEVCTLPPGLDRTRFLDTPAFTKPHPRT